MAPAEETAAPATPAASPPDEPVSPPPPARDRVLEEKEPVAQEEETAETPAPAVPDPEPVTQQPEETGASEPTLLEPQAPSEPEEHLLVIQAQRRTPMRISCDGVDLMDRPLIAGERTRLRCSGQFRLNAPGDTGLRFWLDGASVGPPGPSGSPLRNWKPTGGGTP